MTERSEVGHGHEHALGDVPVLDIGGDVGAMVARLAADTATSELYAHPVGAPDKHFHTGVHCRHDGTTRAYIAVFPQVTEGTYHLLHDDGSVRATVTITGGSVTQVDLGVADRSTDAQLTHTDH